MAPTDLPMPPSPRSTRGNRRPTPGMPSPRPTNTIPKTDDAPTDTQKPVHQEQISLSMLDIVQELVNHVPSSKKPQVELLIRLATEKPDQQQKVKDQMLVIAGGDAIKHSIQSLLANAGERSALAAPAAAPAPAPAHSGAEPPMPPNLPAIFGSAASTPQELASFKADLLHAFHCEASANSCPIAACGSLREKIQRLRQHVTACREDVQGCLLCQIFGYLRDFHNPSKCQPCGPEGGSTPALGSHMYHDDLLQARQLLPCWDREKGKLNWLSPTDALAQVRSLAGDAAPADKNAASSSAGRSSKRQKSGNSSSSGGNPSAGLSALGSYESLQQGVLQTGLGGAGSGLWGSGIPGMPGYAEHLQAQHAQGGAVPRVPTANAPAPSAAPAKLPLPDNLDFFGAVPEVGGPTRPRGRGSKRGNSTMLDLAMPRCLSGAGFASTTAGQGLLGAGGLAGLGLSAGLSNLNGSTANFSSLNLDHFLRANSLSGILGGESGGLGNLGVSFGDLGALGLSFSKGGGVELKEQNASELSLSGILADSASALLTEGSSPMKRPANKAEQLQDILSDFGPSANSSQSVGAVA